MSRGGVGTRIRQCKYNLHFSREFCKNFFLKIKVVILNFILNVGSNFKFFKKNLTRKFIYVKIISELGLIASKLILRAKSPKFITYFFYVPLEVNSETIGPLNYYCPLVKHSN